MKKTAFMSYSRRDHLFAELVALRLREAEIEVWIDEESLKPGTHWSKTIDEALARADVILVAHSAESAKSSFVTYEWSYGMGKNKAVIPLRLDATEAHPKLAERQFLDFSQAGKSPWKKLTTFILESEAPQEDSSQRSTIPDKMNSEFVAGPNGEKEKADAAKILEYLNQRGNQIASFDRVRRRINEDFTDEYLLSLTNKFPDLLRSATIKGGVQGLGRL